MNTNSPEALKKIMHTVIKFFDEDFPTMTKENHNNMYNWDAPEKYGKEKRTYLVITCLSLNTKYSLSIAAYSHTYGYNCSQVIMNGSKQEIFDRIKDENFVLELIPLIEEVHESLDESMEQIRRD